MDYVMMTILILGNIALGYSLAQFKGKRKEEKQIMESLNVELENMMTVTKEGILEYYEKN